MASQEGAHFPPFAPETEKFKGPEVIDAKTLTETVSLFSVTTNAFRYERKAGDLNRRIEAWQRFSGQIKATQEKYIQENKLSMGAVTQVRVLFGAAGAASRELILEECDIKRGEIENFEPKAKEEIGRKIGNKEVAEKIKSAAWFQQMSWLILRHRNMPELAENLNKFWSCVNGIGQRILGDSAAGELWKNGIEREVAAVQELENLGWDMYRPKAEEDVEEGIDAWGVRDAPEGTRTIMALQVKKPESQVETGIGKAIILYPFPSKSEVPPDAWNTVEGVKKRKEKNPSLRIFPVLMNMPSHANLPDKIARGTGLLEKGASGRVSVLDSASREALRSLENLQETGIKRKKGVVYVPGKGYQGKK